MLADFQALNPQIIPAVPRVFEALYEGICRAMRKAGGIVFVLFGFFTKIAVWHTRIDRILFNKNARFKKTSQIFFVKIDYTITSKLRRFISLHEYYTEVSARSKTL